MGMCTFLIFFSFIRSYYKAYFFLTEITVLFKIVVNVSKFNNNKKSYIKKKKSHHSKIAIEMFRCSSSQSVVSEGGGISPLSVTAGKILYTIWKHVSHSPHQNPRWGPFTLKVNSNILSSSHKTLPDLTVYSPSDPRTLTGSCETIYG